MMAAAVAHHQNCFFLFFSLPEEMSFHIISFLSAEDVCVLARTSRELKRISTENMLWRKLSKRNGWVVTRDVIQETPCAFDYKKYFTEKTLLTKPGTHYYHHHYTLLHSFPFTLCVLACFIHFISHHVILINHPPHSNH